MNSRFVANQLGILLVVISAVMLLTVGVYFGIEHWLQHQYEKQAVQALFASALIGSVFGGVLWVSTRASARKMLSRREALLLVGLSWLIGAALSALPYLIWAHLSQQRGMSDHPFRSFWACYFEAMSGLTTTGASVVADVESLPPSLLLWRATTHWFGGLGIIVLFVAVLPSLGMGGKRLFRSETTGVSKQGVRPQIRDAARTLWYIYAGLTVLEITLLVVAGMSPFDSVCHTFATLATGGFSTRNASIASYDSTFIRVIIIAFMAASGVNFALYYALLRGRVRSVLHDPELRLYLILLTAATIVITLSLLANGQPMRMVNGQDVNPTVGAAIMHSAFTTVSIQTTTGFATADFQHWPFLPKAILILLMFIGGCAGSTGSGMKVIRFWIVFKVLHREIERVFRPQVIRPVRLGGTGLDEDLKLATIAYVLGFIMIFAAGAVIIMLLESGNPVRTCDFATASTASLATLSNIGPGLEAVGPSQVYGWMTWQSMMVMSVLMALGRLELFAIIALVTPRFWRGV